MTARWFLARRFFTVGVALALSGSMDICALAQETAQPSSQTTAPATAPQDNAVPDSPGTVRSQSDQGGASYSTSAAQQASPPANTQSEPAKPLGTAAAEPVTPTGVAASQPAGAAIAPAKQRRARSLLIKVGAIVAGGVAVGTIYALSSATSSKPPGSH